MSLLHGGADRVTLRPGRAGRGPAAGRHPVQLLQRRVSAAAGDSPGGGQLRIRAVTAIARTAVIAAALVASSTGGHRLDRPAGSAVRSRTVNTAPPMTARTDIVAVSIMTFLPEAHRP